MHDGDSMTARFVWLGLWLWAGSVAAAPATPDSAAQAPAHDHAMMEHDHAAMEHDHSMMGHDHAAMMRGEHKGHAMPGLFGAYTMSREASGTAWQPDLSVHEGVHAMPGPWSVMAHGFFDLIARNEGGARGGDKVYGANMLMATASRPLGPGRLGARSMV